MTKTSAPQLAEQIEYLKLRSLAEELKNGELVRELLTSAGAAESSTYDKSVDQKLREFVDEIKSQPKDSDIYRPRG